MKRYSQGLTDDLCGVKCLESIYEYFNTPKQTQYFVKELALADELSFIPQLLRLFARDGFSVIANISNPHIFDLTWEKLPNEEQVEKLHQRYFSLENSKWKRATQEYLLYVQENAKNKVEQKVVSENLLKNHLQKGRIILAFTDNVIFHQRGRRYWDEKNKTYEPDDVRGGSDGHAVIVNGWDQKKGFHIVDPSQVQTYSEDGQYWLSPTILIAGIYSLSGEIGIIWK